MTDAEADRLLVSGMQAGQRSALADLYDKFAPRMMSVAKAILHNTGDAEDLLHDVFLEAWRNAHSYDPARGTVYSWLLVRVRSRAIDRLRSLKTVRQHAMAGAAAAAEPAGRDEGQLSADGFRARKALDALPQAQRMVVELGYFQGLSCSEIAVRCGIPRGTVKSRLASAVVRLRKQLAPVAETA